MSRTLCGASAVLLGVGLVGVGVIEAARAGAETAKPADLDTDPHLVGWWTFDDASGNRATDASGRGRDGALEGGASFDKDSVPGRIGKALSLSRKACVTVSGYKGVAGNRPRTVAAWLKTKSSRGEIVSWGHREAGKMWILGFIRGHVGVTPHGGYLYMNATVHDDAWHHVAVAVDEADRPNLHDHVRLYLDGQPAAIHDIGLLDLWPIDTGSDQAVRIGDGLTGCIDDLRIYDRALSGEEIKALFTQGQRK